MNNDYKSPSFKKLLDSLQQQSWELELLISGFAIFGLFTAYEPIKIEMTNAGNEQQIYSFVIYFLALTACSILLFNLLLHVILRGLWIGALGLRYVSGDIEFDELKYSERFKKYLSKRIVSFDRYIGSLENYCSILFAVSFLLIFYVLAMTVVIIAFVLIANFIIDNENLPSWISQGVGIPLMVFLAFGMFLTFFDFITQGLLKKNKWVSKFYFPIYWVFSKITLAFLYRPLVYNFLDNKFGRRISLALVPVYVIILIGVSVNYRTSNYFNDDLNSNSVIANSNNYEDALTEDIFIEDVAIASKVTTNNFLKIFMVFDDDFDDYIFSFNPSLKPKDDIRGLNSDIYKNSEISWSKRDSLRKAYIKTLNEIFSIQIDSTVYKSEFILGKSIKGQSGFETYLGIKNLPEGKHLLKVLRKRIRKKDTGNVYYATIPFWYYAN